MIISFVVAVAKNNVIGKENDLPWYIPEDLKRFKKITDGGTVLMGRKTFESIMQRNHKPLPNRTNVVLTRDKHYSAPAGVLVFNSMDEALDKLECSELFVIGGGKIFNLFFNQVDQIYLTKIEKNIDGDVFFPKIDPADWKVVKEQQRDGYKFVDYIRK